MATLTTHISELYNHNRSRVQSKLIDQKITVSLTTDTWTSISRKTFSAITCHYITDDWKLEDSLYSLPRLKKGSTAIMLNEACFEPITSKNDSIMRHYWYDLKELCI